MSQTDNTPGNKVSSALENDSFTFLFINLELLRREHKGRLHEGGRESKVEKSLLLGYKIVNEIMASLRVVMPLRGLKKITLTFQRCANLEAQEQWTGFV